MSIAEILLEKGIITPERLAQAMDLRKKEGIRLDRALLKIGALTPAELMAITSEQLAIPIYDLSKASIDEDMLRCIPAKLAYRKKLIPVERSNGTLTVATSDPFDLYAFDEIRLLTGMTSSSRLTTASAARLSTR